MDKKFCFSIFDDTVGSKVLYTHGLDEEASQKLSIRMLMGVHSGTVKDMLKESSAIMPLHDVGGVAYSFFFGVPTKSKRTNVTMACLTYVFNEERQAQLYSKVPVFNFQSSGLAKQLTGLIHYEPGFELDDSVKTRIAKWGDTIIQIMGQAQETTMGVQNIDVVKSAAAPYFFMRMLHKGVDRVIHALFVGRPIVVVCSKEMVKPFLSSLQSLQPRRELLVALFPVNYIPPDQFDVMFATPELVVNYPDNVVIDLTTGVAKNGQESDYAKELIKDLQSDAESGAYGHKEIIEKVLQKMEEQVVKIIRYSGSSLVSQYYALTTNPKQQFANLNPSEMDMAFQIALTRYPEYTNNIDKLYQEITGKKRKFNV